MKKVFAVLLAIAFGATAFAQNTPVAKASVMIPNGIYGGSMSAKTASTTYADTTQGFNVRDWGRCYVGIETAANDSSNTLIQYAVSKDGINFSGYTSLDSLVTSGTVGVVKYVELPEQCMGAYSVRIRVAGQLWGAYSANPSATITTKIIRKHQ